VPDIHRPDGAIIHYETIGSGYPILLLALGGVSSEARSWSLSAINPIEEFSDEFLVIAMDQRHAGGSWNAPEHFSYEKSAADQLAVLDDLGIDKAHVWGGCIGVAYLLRLIQSAPNRITAGVGQDPVGLDHTNSLATFYAAFMPTIELARQLGTSAVIEQALTNSSFLENNQSGPFAPRISHDSEFRAHIESMTAVDYEVLVREFMEAIWPTGSLYFTVDEDFVKTCTVPLLILPGSDEFHPTGIAEKICHDGPNAKCLDVDCRSANKIVETTETIRGYLRDYKSTSN